MTGATGARISRSLFLVLAVVGAVGVAPIAMQQATGGRSCPSLGLLPACYIVLFGYTMLVLSAAVRATLRLPLFLIGWLPIFALAAIGTALESLGVDACPKTAAGIPACYVSLGLLIALAVLFAFDRKFGEKSQPSA